MSEDSSSSKTLSKNARKKELKNKQKEDERRQKEVEKVRQVASIPNSLVQKKQTDDEEMDIMQYHENRLKVLAADRESGINPYPFKMFDNSMSILEYIEDFGSLSNGDRIEGRISLTGTIMSIRTSSSKLFFYDLHGDGVKLQVVADLKDSGMDESDFSKFHSSVKRGDIVEITGFPGKTKRGELSIFPGQFVVLSHCLHMLANAKANKNLDAWLPGCARNPESYILKDQETRFRQRYLDLMLNEEIRQIFKIRDRIISFIVKFLNDLDFLQVQTPLMNMIAGGAAARPFTTHHVEFNKLYMRIAPELYLKELVVGKLDRVFEIGKQFRNEGIDLTHNPEFTTCEFYMAYHDYSDLMKLTEKMLSGMVKELTGGYKIKYHGNGLDKDPIEIDFTPPFRKFDMIPELNMIDGLQIPEDLSSDETNQYLVDACKKFDIKCPPPQTTTRLLDKLVGHFLEVKCVNPSFIINHPEIMSPLAKWHRSRKGLTERFELFVNKHELCNAYTELNDPIIQRRRFSQQLTDRQSGDDEAMALDEGFCTALEYGLPPTAGWGIGIDRLVMFLTDSQNIKEVLLFPAMKPQDELSSKFSNLFPGQTDYETSSTYNMELRKAERRHEVEDKQKQRYRESILKELEALKVSGMNPYPHKFNVSIPSKLKYMEKYRGLSDGEHFDSDTVSLAGTIMSKESSSSSLFVYDLHVGGAKFQVFAELRNSGMDQDAFSNFHGSVRLGDIVGVEGKTKTGELSIFPKSFIVLSHCLHKLPLSEEFVDLAGGTKSKVLVKSDVWELGSTRNPESYVLNDQETRYQQRYLDLILNEEVRQIFYTREKIIYYIEKFLRDLNFLKVETPVMNTVGSGARARPFSTHHNELDLKLDLRTSTKLFLTQLVVGKLDRVFEIGEQFRNEVTDTIHNLEFTTCELCMAYSDYNDLMKLTERLLSGMVKELTGGYKLKYQANGLGKDPIEIDFTPPFRRIDMIEALEMSHIPMNWSSDETNKYLMDACTKFDIKCPPPQTTTRLLDKLVEHFLEVTSTCINPCFIINYPDIVCPLAKGHRSRPGLTEHAELFVNKHSLCNAYTVENDPIVQRRRFDQQLKEKRSGNAEAMSMDESYCTALEYGLVGGVWGMGIDRLVMVLTDSHDIKEVQLFPMMKPPH